LHTAFGGLTGSKGKGKREQPSGLPKLVFKNTKVDLVKRRKETLGLEGQLCLVPDSKAQPTD
jgi:hypothetical protein